MLLGRLALLHCGLRYIVLYVRILQSIGNHCLGGLCKTAEIESESEKKTLNMFAWAVPALQIRTLSQVILKKDKMTHLT